MCIRDSQKGIISERDTCTKVEAGDPRSVVAWWGRPGGLCIQGIIQVFRFDPVATRAARLRGAVVIVIELIMERDFRRYAVAVVAPPQRWIVAVCMLVAGRLCFIAQPN